ncbi:hypothetical protein PybrP1_005641, partial [[Pythium] brassicae (nom. inval.)]
SEAVVVASVGIGIGVRVGVGVGVGVGVVVLVTRESTRIGDVLADDAGDRLMELARLIAVVFAIGDLGVVLASLSLRLQRRLRPVPALPRPFAPLESSPCLSVPHVSRWPTSSSCEWPREWQCSERVCCEVALHLATAPSSSSSSFAGAAREESVGGVCVARGAGARAVVGRVARVDAVMRGAAVMRAVVVVVVVVVVGGAVRADVGVAAAGRAGIGRTEAVLAAVVGTGVERLGELVIVVTGASSAWGSKEALLVREAHITSRVQARTADLSSLAVDSLETTLAIYHLDHFLLAAVLLTAGAFAASGAWDRVAFGRDDADWTLKRAYATSKLCNMLFGYKSERPHGDAAHLYLYTPGFVPNTGISLNHSALGWLAVKTLLKLVAYWRPNAITLSPPAYSDALLALLASDRELPWDSGSYFAIEHMFHSSEQSKTPTLARELWERSMQWVDK